MTRVLHLLTGRGGEACAALCALVADAAAHEPGEHRVVLLGGKPLRDAARDGGLKDALLLPEPKGLTALLPPLQTPLLRELRAADRIDCWTSDATDHARRAGGEPVQPRYAPAALVELSRRVTDDARLSVCDRAEARLTWGVDDDTRVIALLGQTPAHGEAPLAALAMLMAQDTLDCRADQHGETLVNIRLLFHPNQQHRDEAQTTLSLSGHNRLLIQEPRLSAPWLVLPGCDAAMVAPAPGWPYPSTGLRLDWARRAGLPVLVPRSHRPRDIARAMIEWIDETSLTRA